MNRLALPFVVACIAVVPEVQADDTPRFNRDVRAILSDRCFPCHGPDGAKRQAGLRLDLRDQATKVLDSGAVAVSPGEPDASELLRRVTSADPAEVMPPPESKLQKLSPKDVDTLRRWIAAGAEYQSHWTFLPTEPVTVPPPPAKLPPGVTVRTPLDRLIFARLAARGLAPQPEADRSTLLRRVSFDLTGLPPTPAEVEAFLKDDSPQAYERVVDRLLESPRYGERMAADWLDLARYADSFGFQVDRERDMWPWRDWVIKSFNRNLPWDRFVTWQLAGDLLPDATDEQILATAFNRLHPQEAEGGSIEEEYRVNYVNDRVVTFGTAFLGLTLECCRCHDHKFDPITQKEYYGLFAFFDDVDEAGLYSFFTPSAPTPTMWLLDDSQKRQHAAANEAIVAAEGKLAATAKEREEAFAEWLTMRPAAPAVLPGELARFSFDERSSRGTFPSAVDEKQSASSAADNVLVEGRVGKALQLTGDHAVTTTVGNFHRYDPFTVSLWLKTPDVKERAVVMHRSRAWTDAASRGYELLIEEGKLKWSLIHFWPGNAISIRTKAPLPVNEWVHVAVTSDGSSRAAGTSLVVNGRPAEVEVVRDGLTRDVTGGGGDTIALGERFRDRGFTRGLVDDVRVFGRDLTPLELRDLFEPGTLAAALGKPTAELSDSERDGLRAYYGANFDGPLRELRVALHAAREAQAKLADAARELMVMRDMPQPKTAFVLKRGEYDRRADAVEPGTPAALPPFPAGMKRNRLGLARWLTDSRHPLLARVTVNRFWQSLFGRGLVKTSEDLGSQSDRPEYPEALDWLARVFVGQDGSSPEGARITPWDVKALLRTIVLSHVYRQSSAVPLELRIEDPENMWLARGPRHRLPAEMIRDGLLSSCGLLVEKIGGPPVRTYDLPESFKPSPAGQGEQLYRRSLYTFWRRTGPAPVLEAFDVPKRVVCVARRDTTNSPLHAFVLLNAPQFVEAARVLAESLHKECDGRTDDMLDKAFLRLSSRPPDDQERTTLRKMFDAQHAWYGSHAEDAVKYLAIGERKADASVPAADLAAMAAVINALMSYDGCVVKR